MTIGGNHPAVFAGLTGSAMKPAPTLALNLPIERVVGALSNSLVLQFVVGCAIGAAVAGTVVLVGERLFPAKDEGEEPDDKWSTSSLNMMNLFEEPSDDDPTGDLKRYRTGQITIDLAALAQEQALSESRRPYRGAHFAVTPAKEPAAGRSAKHSVAARAAAPAHTKSAAAPQVQTVAPVRGRHFAGSMPATPAVSAAVATKAKPEAPTPQIVAPVSQASASKTPHASVAAPRTAQERLASLPVIESRYARVPAVSVATPATPEAAPASLASTPTVSAAPQAHEHAAKDQRGEKTPGITGRLRTRVREVLVARLSGDALDGVPIITRADGSVGDVRPTWFDQNVVPALASITGVTGKLSDTAERVPLGAEMAPRIDSEPLSDGTTRAAYISQRVAQVDEGIFPELRSADDLEHEDAWEEALAAMGENIAQSTPIVFQDVVGGPATIDDPEGLEPPTGFIPFRVPAAHPEVVDMETYVDYLLRDEISQNGSSVLKQSPHAHLRVIEGGTGSINKVRPRRRTGDTGTLSAYTGRHFAQPSYAQEAL